MSANKEPQRVNEVRLWADEHEITVDFWVSEDDRANLSSDEQVKRMVMPLSIAREFLDLLHQAIEEPENLPARDENADSLQQMFDRWDQEGRILDLEDDWVDKLRAGSDERLKDIYGADDWK